MAHMGSRLLEGPATKLKKPPFVRATAKNERVLYIRSQEPRNPDMFGERSAASPASFRGTQHRDRVEGQPLDDRNYEGTAAFRSVYKALAPVTKMETGVLGIFFEELKRLCSGTYVPGIPLFPR